MIAIVVSRADAASERIGRQLLEIADWSAREDPDRPDAEGGGTYHRLDSETGRFELRTFEEWHLELDGVAEAFADPDLVVFASRHSGETGPLLTAHFTGNFGSAEFGGRDRELAAACPAAHKRLLERFREHAPEGYEVGMECTHHGPSAVGAPSLFAELGSDEEQWADDAGARAVARSILEIDVRPRTGRAVVAFGGGHYVPRPERIVRETPWAVGHVGADWCLEAMGAPDPAVIGQAFERSGAELAVVDGEYPTLESAIEELGYRVVSETWLREVGDRPLELVDRLESALGRVDDGLRFGDRSSNDEVEIARLPGELVEAARAVDADAVREAVETHALAFETAEGGTRVGDRAAFAAADEREALVSELASILEREYEVRREPEAITVHERRFDPEKAATLGVPEGPAFGRLASGEAVEVDGRTIEPEAVHTERVRTLPRSP
ncbi:D-aminoacyl-tRNA deacylase [Halalkalicoccus salilacus]|uniref:D-aminoacyl-tRNA deacylase n=1 Tax=Halalkalicoccus TaxID=332246 RepID=UPI002F967D53